MQWVEHRNLCPDQIKLFEPPGSPSYLLYTEDASKNNPGGLEDSPETSNTLCQRSEEVRQDHVILDGRFFFNTNCHSKIGNLL